MSSVTTEFDTLNDTFTMLDKPVPLKTGASLDVSSYGIIPLSQAEQQSLSANQNVSNSILLFDPVLGADNKDANVYNSSGVGVLAFPADISAQNMGGKLSNPDTTVTIEGKTYAVTWENRVHLAGLRMDELSKEKGRALTTDEKMAIMDYFNNLGSIANGSGPVDYSYNPGGSTALWPNIVDTVSGYATDVKDVVKSDTFGKSLSIVQTGLLLGVLFFAYKLVK